MKLFEALKEHLLDKFTERENDNSELDAILLCQSVEELLNVEVNRHLQTCSYEPLNYKVISHTSSSNSQDGDYDNLGVLIIGDIISLTDPRCDYSSQYKSRIMITNNAATGNGEVLIDYEIVRATTANNPAEIAALDNSSEGEATIVRSLTADINAAASNTTMEESAALLTGLDSYSASAGAGVLPDCAK